MASGIQVSDDCVKAFQELKLGKKFKYILFNLNHNLTEIIVEKESEESDYDDFIMRLPENECRWAVYDFEFELEDGGKRNKLCFFSWSPDAAKIKQKMVFASSRDALRRKLNGIHIEIQGTDLSEVEYGAVLAKARSGTR